MSDIEKVARCMPGLALDGPPQGDKVAGRLEARIGPITASFAGEGTIRQMPADYRQVIEGRGGDRRSGSRASGSVDYRLSALPAKVAGNRPGSRQSSATLSQGLWRSSVAAGSFAISCAASGSRSPRTWKHDFAVPTRR